MPKNSPTSRKIQAFSAADQAKIREYRRLGLYSPTGNKATPARVRRLRELEREYRSGIDSGSLKPIHYKKGSKQGSALVDFAKSQGWTVTGKAVIVPDNKRVGKLSIKQGKTGKLLVRETITTDGRKPVVTYIPLSPDAFSEGALTRLMREAEAIGSKMNKDQRLYFKVNGKMAFGNVFATKELLLRRLAEYDKTKTDDEKVWFGNNVEIVVEDKNFSRAEYDARQEALALKSSLKKRGLRASKYERAKGRR